MTVMSFSESFLRRPTVQTLVGADDASFVTMVASLTLGILIFHGFNHAYFSIPFQLLAVAFLIYPALQRQGTFWFVVVCFSAAAIWLDWRYADNHKYLLGYWVLALFLAFETPSDTRTIIRQSARYLLFFTMALAVAQKTLSPDYLNGDFFEFIFMTDRRFSAFAVLLTDIDPAALEHNRWLYSQALDPAVDITKGAMTSTDSLSLLAKVVTWINYIDQLVIAFLLLIPLSLRGEALKHILLMAFIVPVYAVAPVIGFGWLIITWGYCLVPDELSKMRLGYIALFLLLCVYEFPWLKLLL